MRRLSIFLLVLAFVAAWSVQALVSTATAEEGKEEGKHEYIGASKCKICHKKEEAGDQWQKWLDSPHAKAYETLGTEASMEIAKKVGVEKPQESDTCLRCHVTGHGAPAELLGAKYTVEEGVGCEACHGAGGDYYKKKTMAGITAGEIDGASVGLVRPTEEACVECHNDQSPTFKGFDYEKFLAQIDHSWPEAYKKSLEAGGSR
jgi:hypothetical protein